MKKVLQVCMIVTLLFIQFILIVLIVPILLSPRNQIVEARRTPILTTTAIVEVYEEDHFKGILLMERRKAPFGKEIPGGKVHSGETVEKAIRRAIIEEVTVHLSDLQQFHVYSEPSRDLRHHSIEVTHIAKTNQFPIRGYNAAHASVVKLDEIPWSELAFDHEKILKDYIAWKEALL